MKRWEWYSIIILLIMLVITGSILIFILCNRLNTEINKYGEIARDKQSDSITNSDNNLATASYVGTKVSPNAKLIFKIFYKKCGDTIVKEEVAGEDIVNKNEFEFSEVYKDWEIKKFSSNEIILYREEEANCGEDYYIRCINGAICVMKVNKNGKEDFFKNTQIELKYLPSEDRNRINSGIKVKGLENVNRILEDLE